MDKDFSEKRLGKLIQRTLLAGVSVSLLLFLSGFVLEISGSGRAGAAFSAAVAALLLTPVARVAMLVYGFWRTGERKFSFAAFMVLSLLFISVLL